MKEKYEEFNGFNFSIKGSDVVSDISKAKIYDSSTGLTGDVTREDTFFNERMSELDEEINQMLRDHK